MNKTHSFKKLIRNLRLQKEVFKHEKNDIQIIDSDKSSRSSSKKD